MADKANVGPQLDPFRARQASDVAGRFRRERDRQQRQADLMWLGVMAALFSDHELRLLDDLGFLSQRDRDLLYQAGRGVIAAGPRGSLTDMPALSVAHMPESGKKS